MDKGNAAKVVRAIMNASGRSTVFNNIYKSGTRTVKCYGRPEGFPGMLNNISRTLNGLQVPFVFNYTRGSQWHGGPAIIVKLV